MINDIFENLRRKEVIKENLAFLKEGRTWEQIALALYQILDDIDTMSDACKDNLKAFQDQVLRLQAGKNAYLYSPDGYILQLTEPVDGETDGKAQTAAYPDMMLYNMTSPPNPDMREAVATELNELEQRLKNRNKRNLNGELKVSTWGASEANYRKFLLLSDGTIVPVSYSHLDAVDKAGIDYIDDLYSEGAVAGYVDEVAGDMGLRGDEHLEFSPEQILSLKKLYNKYPVDTIYADMYEENVSYAPNASALVQYLRTGKPKDRKAWEKTDPNAEIKDVGSNEGDYEKGGFDSGLVSNHDVSRYPPSKHSSSNNKPRRPEEEDAVVEAIGTTEAGWIHPDGKVEYFSSYAIGDHDKDAYAKLNPGKTLARRPRQEKAFDKYLKQGHIRFTVDKREVDVMLDAIPTDSQMRSIGKLRRKSPSFYFSIVHGDDGDSWKEFIELISIYRETGSTDIEESLAAHAERELKLAGLFDKDSDYEGMLGEAVLALMELFAEQGHSGLSAPMVIELFSRLAKFEPLTELTDNPDEWNDVSKYQGNHPGWQSERSPSCFSTDGGKTYYDLDELAVTHEEEDGESYQTYDGKKVMKTSKSYKM